MKIVQNLDNSTLSLGDIDSKEFGIDTSNGIIFDILRNKMYSNKIAAVAREVASNSRDANVENNKGEEPIEIEIISPNVFISPTDMQIVFKDKGIGISPDRMDNVFLKYGASSKRDTNTQVGGFGLGAKTPFAYTDTFTVITTCDFEGKRIKYTYTASIADRNGIGCGEMVLFDSREVIEETGTSIIVPIKESDRYEFEKEVLKTTCFWKIHPILKNFHYAQWKFETLYTGNGFRILDDIGGKFNDECFIVIAGIPYVIDRSIIKNARDIFNNYNNAILCLDYDNGDLTIAANREAVQYDRITRVKLEWKIRSVLSAVKEELNKLFLQQDTYLKACILNNILKREVKNDNLESKGLWISLYKWSGMQFTYKDQKLIEKPDFKYISVMRCSGYDDFGKHTWHKMNVRKFDSQWEFPMYILDSKNKHAGRTATLYEKGVFLLISRPNVVLKDSKGKDQEMLKKIYDTTIANQQAELDLLKLLIGKDFESYNAVIPTVIPKIKLDSIRSISSNEVNIPVRKVCGGNFIDWDSNSVTFLKKEKQSINGYQCIYFITNSLSAFNAYKDQVPKLPSNTELIKGLIASNLLKKSFVIVSERNAKWFIESNQMTIQHAWDSIKVSQLDKIEQVLNYKARQELNIPSVFSKLKLKGRLSLEAYKILKTDKSPNDLNNLKVDYKLLENEGIKVVDIKPIQQEIKDLYKKYPLLHFFSEQYRDYSSSMSSSPNEMNKIMDMVDQSISVQKEEINEQSELALVS